MKPQTAPPTHAAQAIGKAVHPNDPRSVPRIMVWVGAVAIISSFAYKATETSAAATNDRSKIVKEHIPPTSSAVTKIMADQAPMVEEERGRYESLGKEGLGVDSQTTDTTARRRTSLP